MGVVQLRLQQRSTPSRAVLMTAPLAVMAYLYNRTHSLLLVGVAHAIGDAMATGSPFGDAFLPTVYGRNLGPLHLFAFAVLGALVWISTRGRLGHTQ